MFNSTGNCVGSVQLDDALRKHGMNLAEAAASVSSLERASRIEQRLGST